MSSAQATRYEEHGLAARRVAYRALNGILFRNRSLDEALEGDDGLKTLPARDRSFARLLVTCVLKHAVQMDMLLGRYLRDPVDALKPVQLVNVFRLGIAQYAFLETPVHAAVNTTVALAEAEGIAHHKPLVNAVMRRMTEQPFPHTDAPTAGRLNTPEWLWRQWEDFYGRDAARQIVAAHMGEGTLDFSVRRHPEQWEQALDATRLPTGTLRRRVGGFVPDMPGFTQGAWWVQNAAAALPALLLGDVAGKTVIDLCAAPGGKSAQLAARGARVTAVDRSPARLARLDENMQRLGLDVQTVVSDGAVWRPREQADAVLLDAPCTATGTLRHQPDVLYLKTQQDQDKLVALQRRLLLNAATMLKPGGVLLYCTCSLQASEGEEQTDWLLQQENVPLAFAPFAPDVLPQVADMVTPRGDIRVLPFHWAEFGGMDGFYIARFIRS